jgi:hypothetical protein
LDRFEQDYRRKLAEVESLNLPRRGEGIVILQNELKQQKKLVKSLQKKSLWSQNLAEIIEKLVDVVSYIRQTIVEVFGNNGLRDNEGEQGRERLGEAGLSLHYANLIQQIDNIVSLRFQILTSLILIYILWLKLILEISRRLDHRHFLLM